MSHQIGFFATDDDWLPVVESVSARLPIHFVAAGLFDSPRVERIVSLASQASLIQSSDSDLTWLAVPVGVEVRVRAVPQASGGVKHAVDQLLNRATVELRPSRRLDENTLVAGRIATIWDEPESKALFGLFRNYIRKHFTHIKSAWVSPEATHLLDSGARLTFDPKAPTWTDMTR